MEVHTRLIHPDQVKTVSLSSFYEMSDHATTPFLSGTFVPVDTKAEVEVQINATMTGAAHMNVTFAWNDTVAPGSDLLTGQGTFSGSFVANTNHVKIGGIGTPGNVNGLSRRFIISGLTPGLETTFMVVLAATGYYNKIEIGQTPVDLVTSHDGRRLFVTSFTDGHLAVVDPANSFQNDAEVEILDLIDLPSAYGVVAHPTDRDIVYVSQWGQNRIVELNWRSATVLREWTVTAPTFIAIDDEASDLWVVQQASNQVVPIALSTGTIGTPIATGASPRKPVWSGGWLYVPCFSGSRVDRIWTATRTHSGNLSTGANTSPIAVAAVPDGTKVWVLQNNAASQRMREIDAPTFTFTGTIQTGLGTAPNDLDISPTGKSIVVVTGHTSQQFQSYVLPSKGVRYENGTVTSLDGSSEGLIRIILAPNDGSTYAISGSNALHYWQGMAADFHLDFFWGNYADVNIRPVIV